MSFGSQLLAKRHGGTFTFATLAGGTLLLAIAGFFMTPCWRAKSASMCFGTFGLFFMHGGAILLTNVFKFYESGLIHHTLFGRTEIRYRDLRGFSYAEEKRFAKYFIPAGSAALLTFVTAEGKTLQLQADSVKSL